MWSEVTSSSRKHIALLVTLRLGHMVLVISTRCILIQELNHILGPKSLSVLVWAVSCHIVSSHALSTLRMMTVTTESHECVSKGRENWSLSQSPYSKSQKRFLSPLLKSFVLGTCLYPVPIIAGVSEHKHPDGLELQSDCFYQGNH